MSTPHAPLTQSQALPGNLLRRCHQISVAIFINECQALGVTQLQYIVLCALEERGILDQRSIGELTALDRNTTAIVVKKLETRGLVSRRRNENDRRSMQVSLTRQGRDLRQQAEASVLRTQDAILAPLEPDERETFRELLQKIAQANNDLSRVPLRSN